MPIPVAPPSPGSRGVPARRFPRHALPTSPASRARLRTRRARCASPRSCSEPTKRRVLRQSVAICDTVLQFAQLTRPRPYRNVLGGVQTIAEQRDHTPSARRVLISRAEIPSGRCARTVKTSDRQKQAKSGQRGGSRSAENASVPVYKRRQPISCFWQNVCARVALRKGLRVPRGRAKWTSTPRGTPMPLPSRAKAQ